jgi:prepilin-type N-terminal cleavage/methylation domain-containing protein
MKGFTTKRESQKRNSDFSFANECREQNRLRGFTLVETMVAVSILTLSVAGPLFTANRAIVAAMVARDQLVASYLAQEGIEYVRAMRDDGFLAAYQAGGATISNAAWTDFLSGGSDASITQCRATTCTLDPASPMGTGSGFSLQPCTGDACTSLYLANGIYTEQSGIVGATLTPFTRTIQAIDISANDERIVSTVTWSYHGTPYSVTVYDHLTPWQ